VEKTYYSEKSEGRHVLKREGKKRGENQPSKAKGTQEKNVKERNWNWTKQWIIPSEGGRRECQRRRRLQSKYKEGLRNLRE